MSTRTQDPDFVGNAGKVLKVNPTETGTLWEALTGTGTVTNVSSANADITVANPTTTPVLTMVQAPALRSATTTVNVSSATAPTAGQVLTATSGTAATWVTPVGTGWNLTGNAGTTPGTNFIGTTDNVDFSIGRNSLELIRIGINLGGPATTIQTIQSTHYFIFRSAGYQFTADNPSGQGWVFDGSTSQGLELRPYGSSAGNTREIKFIELVPNGTNSIGFKAPDSIATDITYVLPTTSPTAGQVLSATTPSGGVSTLSWVTASTGTDTYDRQTGITGTGVTLPSTPLSNRIVDVYKNGLLQQSGGIDYTLSGTSLTFSVALIPADVVISRYNA